MANNLGELLSPPRMKWLLEQNYRCAAIRRTTLVRSNRRSGGVQPR